MSNFFIQRLQASDSSVRHAGDAPTLAEAKQRMLAAVHREVDRFVNRDHLSVTVDHEPLSSSLYSRGIMQCRYTILSLDPQLIADYEDAKPREHGKTWPAHG